jgi:hypothetical protein
MITVLLLVNQQAEKDGADTDTDTGANEDERGDTPAPFEEVKDKTAADMLADAAAEVPLLSKCMPCRSANAVQLPSAMDRSMRSSHTCHTCNQADEAADSPAPRAGDANSGVSSDSTPGADKVRCGLLAGSAMGSLLHANRVAARRALLQCHMLHV